MQETIPAEVHAGGGGFVSVPRAVLADFACTGFTSRIDGVSCLSYIKFSVFETARRAMKE